MKALILALAVSGVAPPPAFTPTPPSGTPGNETFEAPPGTGELCKRQGGCVLVTHEALKQMTKRCAGEET